MSDNRDWVGGPNFFRQKKWGNGRNNDGARDKSLLLTKRHRFNPNPYGSKSQSDADKARNLALPRPVVYIKSYAKGMFHVG